MEPAPSRRIRNVANRFLGAMSVERDASWDLDRARALAGPNVSVETCRHALTHLEHLGALVEVEPGVWRRRERWPGTQADWYS